MNSQAPQPHTFQPDIYDKVVSLLPGRKPCRILDAGAGQGYLSYLLKEKGYEVDACDYNAGNFRCQDISFSSADLNERLPYEDNIYDCTLSIEVIEHLENHFRFISELVRVTKPNGLIIITTPNVLSLPSRWHFFLYGYSDCAPLPLDPQNNEFFMQHINPANLPELIFQFERYGADIVNVTTNRLRKSAFLPMLFYPFFALALRRKLLRRKHKEARPLHRRHIQWLLSAANMMGRITIAVAKKRSLIEKKVSNY